MKRRKFIQNAAGLMVPAAAAEAGVVIDPYRFAGGGSWLPTDEAGLRYWLEPPSTFTDGDQAPTITDLGGSGINWHHPGGWNKPRLYHTSPDVIRSDPADQHFWELADPSSTLGTGLDVMVMVRVKTDTVGTAKIDMGLGKTEIQDTRMWDVLTWPTDVFNVAHTTSGFTHGNWHTLGMFFSRAGNTDAAEAQRLYVDGSTTLHTTLGGYNLTETGATLAARRFWSTGSSRKNDVACIMSFEMDGYDATLVANADTYMGLL